MRIRSADAPKNSQHGRPHRPAETVSHSYFISTGPQKPLKWGVRVGVLWSPADSEMGRQVVRRDAGHRRATQRPCDRGGFSSIPFSLEALGSKAQGC